MFQKDSRYSKCNTYTATNSNGSSAIVVYPRTLNSVESSFEHTVADNDRLDFLSGKYYKKPKKWWQICDANPEIMFPSDLLNCSPIVKVILQLEITEKGDEVMRSLAILMQNIKDIRGVIDAIPQDTHQFNDVLTGKGFDLKKESVSICIEFNKDRLSIADLNSSLGILRNEYVDIISLKLLERAGEKINLPPDQIIR